MPNLKRIEKDHGIQVYKLKFVSYTVDSKSLRTPIQNKTSHIFNTLSKSLDMARREYSVDHLKERLHNR